MSHRDHDYYAVLGVDRGASPAEIDRAYRRAARATHPDAHPGEPSAGERFAAVAIAYQTLGDPGRRASYDGAHQVVRGAAGSESAARRSGAPVVPPVHLGRPDASRDGAIRPFTSPRTLRLDGVEHDLVELARALSRLLPSRRHWF